MRTRLSHILIPLLVLTACASDNASDDRSSFGILGSLGGSLTAGRPAGGSDVMSISTQGDYRRGHSELVTGSVGSSAIQAAGGAPVTFADDGKAVSLNFNNVELQEFVRIVFDEVLKENVIVEPDLTGRVTLHTVAPISKSAAGDLVRNALEMNGAKLSKAGASYRVAKSASGRSQFGGSLRVIPLRYIDPSQAKEALQSFASQGTEIIASPGGRLLVVSGPGNDLETISQVAQSFDVDQMRGMSLALVPLNEARSAAVAKELETMFGNEKTSGLKVLSIDRMNAVMIVGVDAERVTRAKQWLGKLDQAGYNGRRVFVYPVQNRRATDLADVLSKMLGTGGLTPEAERPVAPGVDAGTASTQTARVEQAFATAGNSSVTQTSVTTNEAGPLSANGVAISADTSTNSVIVIAKPEDYRIVELALRRLDILPSQVLIEATIAEVTLTNSLKNGVRWYFESGNHAASLIDEKAGVGGGSGFNYVFSVPRARVVVNALESMTDVQIISSPALTVLDNQTATLKVGDQVPIATRSARSTIDPDAPIVNDIELKETGLILQVTPRVNAGGLVQLDISQEASDVVATTTSGIDSPTIRQRKVNSSIAVQSGTEIVLGGLISNRRERTRAGVPFLKDIPLVGEAFTSDRVKDNGRTELLIIIRPIVMASNQDAVAVTQEIKSRMRGITGGLQ